MYANGGLGKSGGARNVRSRGRRGQPPACRCGDSSHADCGAQYSVLSGRPVPAATRETAQGDEVYNFVTVRHSISRQLLLLLSIAASAPAQSATVVPDVETILVRMAESRAVNRTRFRPYVVTRDYTLFGKDRDNSKSEVTAELSFVPPNTKAFRIRESSGSGLGERIVRQMLEGETEIAEDYGSSDISLDNYDFKFSGVKTLDGRQCYVLETFPKRKRKNLVRGSVWVDVGSYLLRRLEGAPAKSPSWWLRNVRLSFTYSEVEGMWLQTASEYTTNVRIFGHYAITSRDVKYDFDSLAAAGLRGPAAVAQTAELDSR